VNSADRVADLFVATFGGEPVGVWSAPGRVNLIGEHTDYTGGFVMPLAIEHRAYVAARPRPDRLIRASAEGRPFEEVLLDDVGALRPAGWLAYLAGSAWLGAAAAAPDGASHGWDLALASDVPIGAGLSSSAAITCATLLAMDEIAAWGLPRGHLARLGQQVENEVVGMPCGIMDQSASLQCVAGNVLFMDTRSGEIEQVPWQTGEDDVVLLVTNTNAPHMLVDGQYANRRSRCEEATELLHVDSLRDATLAGLVQAAAELTDDQAACARHVITENARVLRARDLLIAGRIAELGPVLTASHASLRDDFHVTVPPLDVSVDTALAGGAFGARMTGGGFGGCTIALVPRDRVEAIGEQITQAFHEQGFTAPAHFATTPAQGARRER
jgi:galactokinase